MSNDEKIAKTKKAINKKYPKFPWKKDWRAKKRLPKAELVASCEQVAMHVLLGKNGREIAKELNWDPSRVSRLMSHEITQKLIRKGTASSYDGAKKQLKERLNGMVEDALDTLHKHIQDGNLEGAKELFKIIGATKEFQGELSDHGIQINIDLGDKRPLVPGTDKTADELRREDAYDIIDVKFEEEPKK